MRITHERAMRVMQQANEGKAFDSGKALSNQGREARTSSRMGKRLARVFTVQEAQQVLWVGKRRSENCNREKRDLDADRRQRAIDAVWEQTLMEKRLQAEEPSPAENRDTRRFNSLEEAEQFAKEMRRTNRIYTELCPENTEEVA